MLKDYRDLVVWQKAMEFVERIYRASDRFPKLEEYGLKAQIRRGAVSVRSNIAEGHSRTSTREYLHHLSIARGSLCEVETQLLLAGRLHYLDESDTKQLIEASAVVKRLMNALLSALRNRLTSQPPTLNPNP
jgi:four helix bundle protein